MLEKKEKFELKDEDLENVTGGGSGTIPEGGIIFEEYVELQPDYYYSQYKNFQEVVYVYIASGKPHYTREAFSIDTNTNSWISRSRNSGSNYPIENVSGFMTRYKYRLNVQP